MKPTAAPQVAPDLAAPGPTGAAPTGWSPADVVDAAAMARVRAWADTLPEAGDLSAQSDDTVMAFVDHALADGRLHDGAVVLKRMAFVTQRQAPAPAPPSPPAPAPRPRAPAAPAAAAAPTLDVAAMVAVLRQAARDGVPFCEECERAESQRGNAGATA